MQIKKSLKENSWLKGVRVAIAVCLAVSLFTTHFVVPQTISASSETYLFDKVIRWADGSTEHVQIDDEYFFILDGEKRHLVGMTITTTDLPYGDGFFYLPENLAFLDKELTYLESIGIRLIRVEMGYIYPHFDDLEREADAYKAFLDLFYEHKMLVINGIFGKYLPGFNSLENFDFPLHDATAYGGIADTFSLWVGRCCDVIAQYPNNVAVCAENELDYKLQVGDHWAVTEDQAYTAAEVAEYMPFLTGIITQKLDDVITHNLMINRMEPEIKQICVNSVDVPAFSCYESTRELLTADISTVLSMLNIQNNWWCLEIGYRDDDGRNAYKFYPDLIDTVFDNRATVAVLWPSNIDTPNWSFFDSNGDPIPSLVTLAAEIDRLQAPISSPVLDYIGNKSASEGEKLLFTISATDPQNDPLTYSASNLPPGAQFGGSVICFSWSAVPGATKYRLEVNSSLTWELDTRLYYANVGNVLSKEVSGFPNDGTVFYWRVWAGNASGWSVPSSGSFINGISVTSSPTIFTSPVYSARILNTTTESPLPTLLSPINNVDLYGDINDIPSSPVLSSPADGATVAGSSVTFEWNAIPGATYYRIRVKRASDMSLFDKVTMRDATSYIMNGFPEDGTEYVWQVKAYNADGWGDYSPLRSFVNTSADTSPPPIPTLSSPADSATVAGSSVTFEWNASSGAIVYRMQVKRASDMSLFNRVTLGDVTSYDMGGFPEDGTEYVWQVRAYNASGWSDYSPLRSFVNTSATTSPPPPVLLSPADGATVAGSSVTFEWNAIPGATYYRIRVNRASDMSLFNKVTMRDATSYVMNDFPEDGTEYVWQVRAYNDAGWGDYSDYYHFTSESSVSVPSEPTLLYPHEGATVSSSANTFSWTPADGQAGMYLNVHFEVSDGEHTDFEDIAISVSSADTSHITLRPIVNGAYTQLTPVNGGSNYTKVDENTPDDWETIVARYGDTYRVDTYHLSDPTEEIGSITDVTICARVHANKNDGAVKLSLWTTSGLRYGNEEFILGDNWTNLFMSWDKNPWTNLPWTWRDIRYLQAGIALRGTEPTGAVCTQLYTIVSYNTD